MCFGIFLGITVYRQPIASKISKIGRKLHLKPIPGRENVVPVLRFENINIYQTNDRQKSLTKNIPSLHLVDDIPPVALGPRRQGEVFDTARVPRRLQKNRQHPSQCL